MQTLKSLWLLLTNPIERAEQQYELAAAKLYSHEADLRFQISRLAFYRTQLKNIEPSKDWWRYAYVQDKIEEHNKLLMRASTKRVALLSKYMSCSDRLSALREEFIPVVEPVVWTGFDPPSGIPAVGDWWIDEHLVKQVWNGTRWTS